MHACCMHSLCAGRACRTPAGLQKTRISAAQNVGLNRLNDCPDAAAQVHGVTCLVSSGSSRPAGSGGAALPQRIYGGEESAGCAYV